MAAGGQKANGQPNESAVLTMTGDPKPRRSWRVAVGLLAIAAALTWTTYPAMTAVWAIADWFRVRPLAGYGAGVDLGVDPSATLEAQRLIQKYFLAHQVYLPIEDIAFLPGDQSTLPPGLLLMQNACGRGRLLIWIPFKFKLPISGEKVIEWCWNPQLNPS